MSSGELRVTVKFCHGILVFAEVISEGNLIRDKGLQPRLDRQRPSYPQKIKAEVEVIKYHLGLVDVQLCKENHEAIISSTSMPRGHVQQPRGH